MLLKSFANVRRTVKNMSCPPCFFSSTVEQGDALLSCLSSCAIYLFPFPIQYHFFIFFIFMLHSHTSLHSQCVKFSISPHLHQHLLLSEFLDLAILVSMRQYLIVVLTCISLIINDAKHLFMYLFAMIFHFLRIILPGMKLRVDSSFLSALEKCCAASLYHGFRCCQCIFPLQVRYHFSLADFKILSMSLSFLK